MYRQELDTYLDLIDNLKKVITEKDKQIKNLVNKDNGQTKLLLSIPGISYLSALLLVAEIGAIDRFSSAKKLCSYAGLVPTTSQSADKTHYGRLKKDSNKYIRWILVEAVEHAIKKDPGLATTYHSMLRKKGWNKARVAIAHKLLISVYYMLKNNESYKNRKIERYFRVSPPNLLATSR